MHAATVIRLRDTMAMASTARCLQRQALALRVRSIAMRHFCSAPSARALPEGVEEITSVPSTPSWSLKELHREGAAVDSAEAVLNAEKLRELAELCHLRIDEDKLPSLLKDVESIIQCTKTVQALTLGENIDDLYAKSDSDVGVAPLREDVVTEGNYADKVLANAAEKSGYFFKVPKVLQD